MSGMTLHRIVSEEPGLRMLVVITMPDSLLYEVWPAVGHAVSPEHVAAFLGDLVRVNVQVLDVVGAPQEEIWAIIEAPSSFVLVRQFRPDFALGGIFGTHTTLGAARLSMKRIIKKLEAILPPRQPPADGPAEPGERSAADAEGGSPPPAGG